LDDLGCAANNYFRSL